MPSLAFWVFLACEFCFALPSQAGPPSPAAKVLIIYNDDSAGADVAPGFETAGVTFLQNTLKAISPSPTVDLWEVPFSNSTAPGIQFGDMNPAVIGGAFNAGTESTMTQALLDSYCEVWDVRFLLLQSASPCAGLSSDEITSGDSTFYTSYLAQNGNLFLSMDNSGGVANNGFCQRDTSVIGFASSVIGCTIPYSAVQVENGSPTFSNFTTTYNFSTNFNTLTNVVTDYPGGLLTSGLCGGTALTTDSSGVTVLDAIWHPSGGGALEITMDTNAFCEYAGRTNPGNALYYQNIYTLLANCTPPATNTSTSTPTVTSTQTSTNTVGPTNSQTSTNTLTSTGTPTPTMTSTNTNVPTNTNTVTQTPTNTLANTATNTVTSTQTNTPTNTPISTFTNTMTSTATATNTVANTATATNTVTNSPTLTPTVTPTPGLYAWPNPFNHSTSRDHVFKIGNVSSASHIAFYTVAGELVIDSNSGGKNLVYGALPALDGNGWMWTGANSNGLYVATGVYYYVLQKGSGTSGPVLLQGKLLVVNGN